jgi:hypothetical protein
MRNIYQDALNVQSACNLSGVAKALAVALDVIWAEACANGKGTEYVNRHPVVVLHVCQMAWLATGDALAYSKVDHAINECGRMARLIADAETVLT